MSRADPGVLRPMTAADVSAVLVLQREAYGDSYQEAAEVMECKRRLAPEQCLVWCEETGRPRAYVFAHGWAGLEPPPLHHALAALPRAPEYLFVHDMVVGVELRSQGVARRMLSRLRQGAVGARLDMVLVAVAGASDYWSLQGFAAMPEVSLPDGYGEGACFMRWGPECDAPPRSGLLG